MADNEGWDEYRKLVLAELRRIDDGFQHERKNRSMSERLVWERMAHLDVEIAALKIKAGIWGLMGGLIPALTALLLQRVGT
jgi:hypothetical protein